MATEQERGLRRKQRILDAALDVFTRDGYQKAAVDDISAASQTSKGGVYFHFPGKQAIFGALLERMIALLLVRMDEAMRAEREPAARLDAALRTVLRTFGAHRTLTKLFLVDAIGAGKAFDARMVDIQNEIARAIQRHLDDAVRDGTIPPLDTAITSVAWVGAINQLVTRWIVTGEPKSLDDVYPAMRVLLHRSAGLHFAADDAPWTWEAMLARADQPHPQLHDLAESLRRLVPRDVPQAALLLSSSVRVPYTESLRLFQGAPSTLHRCYWQDFMGSFTLGAAGAAAVIDPTGVSRFAESEAQWTTMLRDARLDVPTNVTGVGPILVGGFAFDPESPHNGAWAALSSGKLVLPTVLLTTSQDESWLTVTLILRPGDDPDEKINEAISLAEYSLYRPLTEQATNTAPRALELREMLQGDEWKRLVVCAAAEVRAGLMDKVVLARAVTAQTANPYDPALVLRQLRSASPGSGYLIALCAGGHCFLGTPPERLVRLRDGIVQSDCLAGSTPRGEASEEDWELGQALLASAKNRQEHAVVVVALRDALTAAGVDVVVPPAPGLRRLGHVQHLHTPLTGHVAGTTILRLLEHIHPTPAVGGFPRDVSLAYIRDHEQLDRGWYAGPFGWLDRHGEGEFAVAIRSALIEGAQAWLFTGCGIVGQSDPEAEYAESVLKLRPMRSALSGA